MSEKSFYSKKACAARDFVRPPYKTVAEAIAEEVEEKVTASVTEKVTASVTRAAVIKALNRGKLTIYLTCSRV